MDYFRYILGNQNRYEPETLAYFAAHPTMTPAEVAALDAQIKKIKYETAAANITNYLLPTPWSYLGTLSYNTGTYAFTEGNDSNYHAAYQGPSTGLPERGIVTVEAKYNGRTWMQLRPSGYANFDIQNGALGTITNGRGAIRSIGDGWYECTAISAITFGRMSTMLCDTDDHIIYAGDGVSGILQKNIRITAFGDGKFPSSVTAYHKYRGGVVIGDSFTTTGFPSRVNGTSTNIVLFDAGVGGQNLTQIVARAATNLSTYAPSFMILQGGINDINAAVADPNTTMREQVDSFIGQCLALAIFPVLTTLPPDKNYALWSATRQGWMDSYNAWILAKAGTIIPVIDLKNILSTDGETLRAEYDSGDGLHPNATGLNAIGDAIVTALDVL